MKAKKPTPTPLQRASERPTVSCDQETLIRNQIHSAIRMAQALEKERYTPADAHTMACGLHGIVEGTTIEIIRTLGLEPSLRNSRVPQTFRADPNRYRLQPPEALKKEAPRPPQPRKQIGKKHHCRVKE